MYLPGDMYYPGESISAFAASAAESSVREAGATSGLFLVAVAMTDSKTASRGSALTSDSC
jgi:hypothetical protein